MMNVKDTLSAIKLKDETRKPWTLGCMSFSKLEQVCNVVSSCKWTGGRGRLQKLTVNTADAFVTTTRTVVEATNHLLTNHHFKYVLPGRIWSDDNLEKFFGKTRQRTNGNFYIDILDVEASAKVQRAHQLMKLDLMPIGEHVTSCTACTMPLDEIDIDIVNETAITCTQDLMSSDSSF